LLEELKGVYVPELQSITCHTGKIALF